MEAPTKELKERILKLVDEDHENFLLRINDRFDRVGIKGPKIEVRYENLSVEGDVNVGSKSIQTVFNSTLHTIEIILGLVFNFPSKKQKLQILKDVSGIVRPSRMTLLLGPPGSGKSTLLLSLAGKLDNDLRVTGRVTYCGHELNEFVPQRICGFVGQHDLHSGQMTPRETLDFSSHALGIGLRHGVLEEISRRETEAGIEPDPEIDAFMQAKTRASHEARDLITDYILKILGLKKCADTIVGDMMRRGISGGEKKRLSIGEMLVGPARVFLMDEISTGLDSSTTFHICKYLSQMVHISDTTAVISLLQPTPETYDLFDDIILLSEGHLVYQGPRENVLEFFERAGFKCPARKGVAEFLQEVTSKKDQEQYWDHKNRAYNYVSALDFVEDFKSFDVGKKLQADLKLPYNKTSNTSSAFVTNKYGATNRELFKACLSKEWLLMKRSYPLYLLKIVLVLVASVLALTVFIKKEMPAGRVQDGDKFIGAMYFGIVSLVFIAMVEQVMFVMRLPVFFKQRDSLFYPAWAFGLPIVLLRIPLAIIETGLWVALTYYEIGFAPDASRFFKHFLAYLGIYQIGMSLALLTGAVGRIQVVANALGLTIYAISVIVGGFFISKSDFKPWLSWTAYLSPLMYGQNAIVMNEFLDKRWSTPFSVPGVGESTAGKVILDIIGVATEESWFWVCIGALFGFVLLFNTLFIAALTYLKPLQGSKAFVPDEKSACMEGNSFMTELAKYPGKVGWSPDLKLTPVYKCGMVFPVRPISLAFSHVNYFVDIPAELKSLGVGGDRLQLLRDVSGAFRPGVLTAIVGVSGAGKTTLMDVLAGRKTTGYIEGNITVSGYPKIQETFRRVSGYCEQEDVHSPYITIYETLVFSAWLRLPKNTSEEARTMFIEEVMELVEITSIREALVGLPGVNGLSIEQRKRVKIAMELVANPSIIYMDEPTSGLDARAAAIVMRTLRNTVDKGRTVICTVHQPSIDIFEAFDELVLMKLGGQVIYTGLLGRHSRELIEFYEAVPGVPKIKDGHNPASWVLDITSPESEAQLNVDFAEIYLKSNLYRKNQELVKELTMQVPGSTCLKFPTIYSQPFYVQLKACLWKHHLSYSRNCRHNVTRMYFTIVIGGFLGLVLWNKGQNIIKQQDVMNLLGSIYIAVVFVGGNNANTIQSIVSVERAVFYRERASGMYSALAYALAQVGIETIYTVIQALILSLITFSMFGLKWTVPNFLWFYYFTTMFLTYMTLTGMMVVSLTPTIEASSVFLSFLIRLWNLFTGFFIPRMQIPSWWSWYYWASPMAWTLNGLVTSQLGDNDSDIEVPGVGTIPLKTFLKEKLGYEFGFLPVVALAHLGWVLLFFFMFVFGIKFLNFQKR